MRFSQGPFRGHSPVRVRAAVFAVGRRVYVACSKDRAARVALTDDAGVSALANVTDGTEVEILAWRPLGSAGTRYRVRSTRDGLEGWLAVGNLRGTLVPEAAAPAQPAPSDTASAPRRAEQSGSSGRRFGQRAG